MIALLSSEPAIPFPDNDPDAKLHEADTYSISELGREFGITNRAIRFYEDKQLLSPRRRGTRRIYSRADRTRLKLVLRAKRLGWPLDEIRSVIDMYDSGADGELKQLEYTCEKIQQQRAVLLQQLDDIKASFHDMQQIEDRCRARIALLSHTTP